jgi:hypothetical protein
MIPLGGCREASSAELAVKLLTMSPALGRLRPAS